MCSVRYFFQFPIWISLALLLVTGCGNSGAELADVTGKVTLDGQPLSGVLVEFQPDHGSPSLAVTDENGDYNLQYTRDRSGARLGKHRVSISNSSEDTGGPKSRIPPRYNRKSTLVVDVDSGSNTHNFDLTSKDAK